MTEIKENGYVRWKPFLLMLGGVLWVAFLYANTTLMSKAEFQAFEKGLDKRLDSIEQSIRDIHYKYRK